MIEPPISWRHEPTDQFEFGGRDCSIQNVFGEGVFNPYVHGFVEAKPSEALGDWIFSYSLGYGLRDQQLVLKRLVIDNDTEPPPIFNGRQPKVLSLHRLEYTDLDVAVPFSGSMLIGSNPKGHYPRSVLDFVLVDELRFASGQCIGHRDRTTEIQHFRERFGPRYDFRARAVQAWLRNTFDLDYFRLAAIEAIDDEIAPGLDAAIAAWRDERITTAEFYASLFKEKLFVFSRDNAAPGPGDEAMPFSKAKGGEALYAVFSSRENAMAMRHKFPDHPHLLEVDAPSFLCRTMKGSGLWLNLGLGARAVFGPADFDRMKQRFCGQK